MSRVSSPNETRPDTRRCAGPGCHNDVAPASTGRPARFCSAACRSRAHRQRTSAAPAVAEADIGSASSRGRHPDRAWLVRIRRDQRSVVVAIGLRRSAADRLVEQINQLLATTA
jgi:hypothetical protein